MKSKKQKAYEVLKNCRDLVHSSVVRGDLKNAANEYREAAKALEEIDNERSE